MDGLDPNEEALALARRAVPTREFHPAHAEAIPFADELFDGAAFLNSLHHVPEPAMQRALREASSCRKTREAHRRHRAGSRGLVFVRVTPGG